MTDAAISLSFPARQGYAIFLRTAVSGAAAAYDLPLDALEDLREAALEAFSTLTESAEEGAQLRFKYFLARKAYAYRTESQGRIFLLGQFKIVNFLVRAYVKRSYNDLFPAHFFRCVAVFEKLLVLSRKTVFFKIYKFAAEKSDSARVIGYYGGNVMRVADVCIYPDAFAAFCFVRLALQAEQQLIMFFVELFTDFVIDNFIVIGVYIQYSAAAVKYGGFAVMRKVYFTRANKRGDVHCPRQNCGV